jgi:hypothetical protein
MNSLLELAGLSCTLEHCGAKPEDLPQLAESASLLAPAFDLSVLFP